VALMQIPLDYARCHDATCPQRDKCCRWLDRERGSVHIATLRIFSGVCEGFISVTPPPAQG
jgi:hypothetical protein